MGHDEIVDMIKGKISEIGDLLKLMPTETVATIVVDESKTSLLSLRTDKERKNYSRFGNNDWYDL